MARGQLRVYLGSAPGVGKTYRMLDEGWRRQQRGTDVVVGYVETHGRPLTQAQLRDLEIIPRTTRAYRGTRLEEMDLEAVLARAPEVVLVDELAHSNVPGGTNAKRWQDVEALLDAGIDVITTVNIQHLESVNDVVAKITGIAQQETVPDAMVRRADGIELVDITPEALRRRLAHGNIYAADKIDAALSNYFRVGNLSALRELSLLWTADRVEDALQQYLDENEISGQWETRERLIVGITGTDVDELLLRRAARIASRTGAEMIAVHVISADGSASPADTSHARALVEEFDGRYHELVDDDIATALVSFARSERGTQVVLGASRPRSAVRVRGGVVENVLRQVRDLDVHIISVGGERPARVRQRRRKDPYSWRRKTLALCLTAVGLPLLTVLMTAARSGVLPSTVFLVYLVTVLGLTLLGGSTIGVLAAIGASALENYYFVAPVHTFDVSRPVDAVALLGFLGFAVGASVVVSQYSRRSAEAERARREAHVLANALGNIGTSHLEVLPLLDSLRAVFDATTVVMRRRRGETWEPDVVSGEPLTDAAAGVCFDIDDTYSLEVHGVTLSPQDRELIGAFAVRIAAGMRSVQLAKDAEQFEVIAQAEALRMDLLRTMSNDLRGPLETIQRAVTQLREDGVDAGAKRSLGVVEEETLRLSRLLTKLVEVSRLGTGNVQPTRTTTTLADLLQRALSNVDTRGRTLDTHVAQERLSFATDPAMVSRAIAIVVDNACRFSPLKKPVRITGDITGDVLEILIIDQGPGMALAKREAILDPLQHAAIEQEGADLGLTVALGFVRVLGGELRFEDTPGGGLTVIIELPVDHAGASREGT